MNNTLQNKDILRESGKQIQNVIDQVRPFFKTPQKSCYYPSAGGYFKAVFSLDADTFFFSDQLQLNLSDNLHHQIPGIKIILDNDSFAVFETPGKRGYYFHLENNVALEVIRGLTPYLNYFIGVRDGCQEGGNFECVNDPPFLQKAVEFCPQEGLSIINDHSEFLDIYPEYLFNDKYIYFKEFLAEQYNSDPIGETRHYRVMHHEPVIHEWKLGDIRLTIEFDNILNHVDTLDGIIGSCACRRRAIENDLFDRSKFSIQRGDFFRPQENSDWSADKSLDLILHLADKRNWIEVGVTAFGQNDHKNFLNILSRYEPSHPLWLRIFHVEKDDFQDLIKLMQ